MSSSPGSKNVALNEGVVSPNTTPIVFVVLIIFDGARFSTVIVAKVLLRPPQS